MRPGLLDLGAARRELLGGRGFGGARVGERGARRPAPRGDRGLAARRIRLLLGDELLDAARQQRVPLVERRGAHVDRAAQLGGALGERLELLAAAAIAFGRDQLGPAGGGEPLAFDLDRARRRPRSRARRRAPARPRRRARRA